MAFGKMKYDFFISYRRANNGTVCGSFINGLLNGYSVFFDIYGSITEGLFENQIREALQNTERFILVVTDGAFSRPEIPGRRDWYYEEIDLAIKYVGLNRITPIIFDGGSLKEEELPPSLKNRGLCGCQSIEFVPKYVKYFPNVFYDHFGLSTSGITNTMRNAAPSAEQLYDDREIVYQRNTPKNQSFNVKGVAFNMIYVPGGTFQMGSNDGWDNEKPIHSVTLNDFYIGETQVTQGLWKAVMGNNPSYFQKGDNYPVEQVSWNDIVNNFLPELNRTTGKNFCLPTEAQWEYAARGGNKSKGYKYSGSNNLADVAWYGYYDKDDKNRTITEPTTMPVAKKKPNELGIYDMSGNVWEWCQDWFKKDYYRESPSTDPQGSSSGSSRVLRGGSWIDYAFRCRVSDRSRDSPGNRDIIFGMRLALPCSPFPS